MITFSDLSRALGISDRTFFFFIKERYSKLEIANFDGPHKGSSFRFSEESLSKIYAELKVFFQEHPEFAEEAIVWYWRIANQGDRSAKIALEQAEPSNLYFLGDCLWDGDDHLPQNKEEAAVCYWKAANRGCELAKIKLKKTEVQYILGGCFSHGNGVLRDAEMAVAWYRKAAENGDVNAQRVLGDCFFNGNGVLENKEDARYWYRKAAENGDVESRKILDEYFFYEEELIEKKEKELVIKLWKAMKQGDGISKGELEKSPSASLRLLGDFLWNGAENVHQNKEEAVAWYWKAENRGDEIAKVRLKKIEVLCLLANCFWDGKGGLPKNKIRALSLYWKAMKQGSEAAKEFFEHHHVSSALQRSLADRFRRGADGVSQNSQDAVIWYQKAAENGDVEAMRRLGDCLFKGIGTFQNREEAVVWYRKAAENGDVEAKRLLDDCLIRYRKPAKNFSRYYESDSCSNDSFSSGYDVGTR
ncbi:MAG: tetratricopeptide repeat protein [Candidatus Spyradosoma sp.]